MRKLTYYLTLLMIFTIPLEGVARSSPAGSITRFIGFALFASWLAALVTTNRIRRLHFGHILVASYVLWFGLTSLWSVNPNATATRFETYFQLFLLFWIIWDLFVTDSDIHWGLQAYLTGNFIAALSTWRNFLTDQAFRASFQVRFTTFAGVDPNSAGVMLALAIPIAWWLAQESTIIRNRRWLRLLNYAYIPIATFAIFLTASRTALLAAVIAYAFILIAVQRLSWGTRLLIAPLLIVSVVLVVRYVPATSFERLNEMGDSVSESNLTGRGDIWRSGIALILDHPLLGLGGGSFPSVNSTGQAAHNLIVSVWAETGLVGLLLYLSIIGTAIWSALRHPRMEAFFWCTLLLIWALGASSLNWEWRKQTWMLFSLVIASAYAAPEHMRHKLSKFQTCQGREISLRMKRSIGGE